MPIMTDIEMKRSFDYGLPFWAWPYPLDEITAEWLAHHWGSFLAGPAEAESEYYISDHVAQAKATLIEQFKRKPNFEAFVEILATRIQTCEDMWEDLLVKRLLETAEGTNLDNIGAIVDEAREGRSDDEYRTAILFKVFINISCGEPETVMTVLKTVTEATEVRLIEFFPATMLLWTNGSEIPSDLGVKLRKVVPAGVEYQIACTYGEIPFEFDTEGGIPYNEGDGFSEYNYTEGGHTIGGKMVELVY